MGDIQQKETHPAQPNNFWSFLQRAFSFFGEVLKAVQKDTLLSILWGFGVLFLVVLIVTLFLARAFSPLEQFGVVVLIVVMIAFLFVYTVPRVTQSERYNSLENENSPGRFVPERELVSFDPSFYYRLTSNFLGLGQSLDVRPKTEESGSHLLKVAQTGNYTGQFWKLVERGGGKYSLRTMYLGDDFSLDVVKDGLNTTPQMAATGNDSSQVWTLVPLGDGTYKLTNDFSGQKKSLGVYGDPPQPYLSTSDDPRQIWKLTQEKPISA